MAHSSNMLMAEMLHNFLSEQNRQLFKEMAKNEGLDYETLCKRYIKPRSHFHEELVQSIKAKTFVVPK